MTMREKMARAMYESDRQVSMPAVEKIWAELLADPTRPAKMKSNDRKCLKKMRSEMFETSGLAEDYYRKTDAALDALMEPTMAMISAALSIDRRSLVTNNSAELLGRCMAAMLGAARAGK